MRAFTGISAAKGKLGSASIELGRIPGDKGQGKH